jgi:Holliday junction resolvase RusA-like endonuclease
MGISTQEYQKLLENLSKTKNDFNMDNKQIIYGNPPSKSNCYKIISLNGHGSLAKTKALKQYENDFFIQCNKYRNANISGYFEFDIDVYYPSQRADLDNSLKVVLDCLQKVKAIDNDNKCVKIVANKFLDKANPRIEFIIKPIQ